MLGRKVDITNERGTALIVALAFLAVLMLMTTTFVVNLVASSNFESSFEAKTKSFYIAEAGLNHAIWKLDQQGSDYQGESGSSFEDGSFDIRIEAHPDNPSARIITSSARLDGYPDGRTESKIRAVVALEAIKAGGYDSAIESWERVR